MSVLHLILAFFLSLSPQEIKRPAIYPAAGGITPPTLISYTETAWNTTGSPNDKTSTSVSWQTNDVIVVIAGSEGQDTLGTPTATGLTFTSRKQNTTAGSCATQLATAVAGSTSSGAITVPSNNGSSNHWGFGVWVWRSSGGVGNSAEQHTSTLSVSLTPTQAHSAIMWGTFDFGAAALQTIIPTPTNTRQRATDASHYTFYVADLADQSSAGATSYGISGSGSGPFSIVVMEIKGQ